MRKYLFITTPIVLAILVLLRTLNVLQGFLAEPVVILLTGCVLSLLFAYIERNSSRNEVKQDHYENLDIMRFIFAIVIVLVHLRPFLGYSDHLDLAFNYIIGRVCVPLFFITTGFFCARKERDNRTYIKKYIKKMLPIYILWSTLYLPFGIQALGTLHIDVPKAAAPFAVIIGYIYTGTYYHLWYFPALFLALIVLKLWKRHFSMRSLLIVSFLLLCVGATETYYGFLPVPLQHFLSTFYFKIFYTTRNFLFFGLFYVALGYVIGSKKQTYVSYSFIKFMLCCIMLVAEALILQSIDRLNSNILLSCVPLSYYLFISLLHMKPVITYKTKINFHEYYKYYYFLHPAIIFIFTTFFFEMDIFQDHYWIQIIIVLGGVHLLSNILIFLKKKYPRALRYL